MIIIHCFQTNSIHLSKEHCGFERLRTIQDSRCPLELQLGQMLLPESAGEVIEDAVGEKFAVFFIEEICEGFLNGIISLWLKTETDKGIRNLYLLLKLLCMP